MPETSPPPSGTPAEHSLVSTLYKRAVDTLLTVPVKEEYRDTGEGRTHLLTAGESSNPPVLVFQGGNVTNPVTLSWVQALADDYYLIAPDTPGQLGKTTVELSGGFGSWVENLLDTLDVDSAAMVGISHGAGVVLEAAVDVSDRIDAAALVVPAGFGTALSLTLLRIVLPSLGYRVLPRQWLLHRALAPMFTQPIPAVEEVVLETVGTALRTGDLRAEFPGPDELEALAAFEAPTLVVTAEHDPFFPGTRTCKRAAKHLPLEDCLMLTDERHFLSPAGQTRATEQIRTLLATHRPESR